MQHTIEELFEEYITHPSLDAQEAIFRCYKISDNKSEMQSKIKHFLRGDIPKGYIDWHNVFESDMKFWGEVYLIQQEKIALECYGEFLNDTNKNALSLKLSAMVCQSYCNNVLAVRGLSDQIEAVWLEVFKELPDFKMFLNLRKNGQEEAIQKRFSSVSEDDIKNVNKKILTIDVPTFYVKEGIDLKSISQIEQTSEYQDFMKQRTNFINSFNLHEYLDVAECKSVSVSIENGHNLFIFEVVGDTDLKKLRDELLVQLSEGVGENLFQNALLIGKALYHFGFDVRNATDLVDVTNSISVNNEDKLSEKIKIKMK